MYSLRLLYNLILETQTFPNLSKSTRLYPILKLGENSKIENYRPIEIVCAPAKVLEQILCSRIFNLVKSYMRESRPGFFPRRSTTNLINFVQNRTRIDVIYIEFAKASDKINHRTLLNKLPLYGFSSKSLNLLSGTFKMSDDAKLNKEISSGKDDMRLQEDINMVSNWRVDNDLGLNAIS
jgi:hypothetical protein